MASIGWDYKRSLYAKDVDPESPDYPQIKSSCHQRSADKLLRLCKDNGGCFIKVGALKFSIPYERGVSIAYLQVGQHIGALDYLLPKEYVSTMKVLHHSAPEMNLRDVFEVIREDLGQDVRKGTLGKGNV